MSEYPPEPTPDQCSQRHRFEWSGLECMAVWYPQMGGYVGKAVVVANDCMETYVWHDGGISIQRRERSRPRPSPPL